MTLLLSDEFSDESPCLSQKASGKPYPLQKQQEPVSQSESSSNCEDGPGICSHLLTIFSLLMIIVCLPFSLFCVVKVVQEYEKVVIFRLGRILTGGARGPGVFFIIPCVDIYEVIDMRVQNFSVPPQEILSKDSVTVFVNAIMYYKVEDAVRAISNVDDYAGSAKALAA